MQELSFPFAEPPPPGTRKPLLDGLAWVRQPLPFALDHVNCWWLEDTASTAGRVLVDTGIASGLMRKGWQQLLAGRLPDTLLVTHFHPDHSGLAGWFAEQGSRLLGSEVEMNLANEIWSTDDEVYGALYADWYMQNGLADDVVEHVAGQGNSFRKIVQALPEGFSWLKENDCVTLAGRDYQVMIGRGHAPAMLMLYCEAEHLLIAADQVLPTISPNVSLMPLTRDDNPLASFLDTLKQLKKLPEDTLVLPSHGLPFHGLHVRLNALEQHHQLRLSEVLDACAEPRTAAALFPVLFRRQLDAQQMSFALGESLAHLRYLERRGDVVAECKSDGVSMQQRYCRSC
ncbi:MAG: MBL fold metallo-hydrolase [Granulosicoccus sp.]